MVNCFEWAQMECANWTDYFAFYYLTTECLLSLHHFWCWLMHNSSLRAGYMSIIINSLVM